MNKYFAIIIFLLCSFIEPVMAQGDTSFIGQDSVQVSRDSSKIARDEKTGVMKTQDKKIWIFGLNGGYSYRLPNAGARANMPYSKYLRELKTGYSIGADIHRVFWPHVSLGLKYNFFNTRGTFDSKNKDNITIQFVGPSVVYQYPFENKTTSVLAGFAMGYQAYANKGMAASKDFKTKGNATGWAVSLGLEQKISNHFALNVSGACYLGTSYKFRKESGGKTETIKLSDEEFENLSRVEITLGLKFF